MTAYIVQALETGFKHLDTAQAYRTEDSVGAALKESSTPREQLWITTKYLGPLGSVRRLLLTSLEKASQFGLGSTRRFC